MSLNTRLSDLLNYMLDVQLTIDQELSEEELARAGTAGNWSIKDNLAHSAEWANRHLADLEAIERGEPWPEHDYGDDEEDGENEVIFDMHRAKSWEEVRAMLQDAYGRADAYLDRVSQEALLAPIPPNPDRPVWRYLAGDHILHPMIHVWEYLRQNDHPERVPELFGEPFTERLLAVSDDGRWRGTTLYNLACIYAQAGKTKQAIEQLAKALALEPGLTEWSKEDADLESLRAESAYQALYESE